MKSLLVLASLAFLLPAVHASAAPASLPPAHPDYRDPTRATIAAVAPTLIGGAMFYAGLRMHDFARRDVLALGGLATLTVGPSLGHFYAGATGRGLATTAIRVGGLALVGGALLLGDRLDPDGSTEGTVPALLVLGAGTIAVSQFVITIGFDIIDAAPAARRRNRDMHVVPTVLPASDGPAAGLAIGGSF